ncbi:MAG: hypothetical protein HXY38_00560 [Chloroflexi bacterium]|nr:hypothetical protein [Chloroflexota bacterium]
MAEFFKQKKMILLSALAGLCLLSFNVKPFLSMNSAQFRVWPFPARTKPTGDIKNPQTHRPRP